MSDVKCEYCGAELVKDAYYCHKCGGQIPDVSMEKILGIELTDDDIESYIFRGFVEKDIEINPKLKVTIKTLTQKELAETSLEADEALRMKNPSDETYAAFKNSLDIKKALVAINGSSAPEEIGVELAAIILNKASMLQKLVLEALQKGKMEDF